MENIIENLFGPRAKFLESYKTGKPVVVHNQLEKFEDLVALKYLSSLDSLLDSWPSEVNAYSPGIADEVNSSKVSPERAKELYANGSGLFFDDPNRFDETLSVWLENLRREMGLSNMTYSRSLIYAIKKGEGTAAHFDQNINFVLQISGQKKWWIADNTSVENPMTRFTIGTEADPELDSYLDEDLPKEFPKESVEFTLKPGSVLFLPRGAWHKTEAIEDALSLNFTYSAPTWIDILQTALRGRLAMSPYWRQTADFVTDPELHTEAIAMFDTLLDQLKSDVPSWQARDILGAIEE